MKHSAHLNGLNGSLSKKAMYAFLVFFVILIPVVHEYFRYTLLSDNEGIETALQQISGQGGFGISDLRQSLIEQSQTGRDMYSVRYGHGYLQSYLHPLSTLKEIVIAFLLVIFIATPFLLSYRLCLSKNRTVAKGMVVTALFSWFAPLGLWLALKTRDPKTRQLS